MMGEPGQTLRDPICLPAQLGAYVAMYHLSSHSVVHRCEHSSTSFKHTVQALEIRHFDHPLQHPLGGHDP